MTPSVATELDQQRALVKHSGMLIDHVISKYRARLRISGILGACKQEDLSRKVWISPEAQVMELKAYARLNEEATSLEEQMLVALQIGLTYYRSGIVDSTLAHILSEGPANKDHLCSSASDAAKLLQAP